MYKELERCIGELQVNHTDKEIAGALSEYFQIVKNVSEDYDDLAIVMDIRADHPELGFMDDEGIEGILEQAETMRQKHKAAEGEYLADGDMRDLFRLNPDWFDLGTENQRYWIGRTETCASIKALAGMVWICTNSTEMTVDKIERTMRGYLEKKHIERQEARAERREALSQKIQKEMERRRGVEERAWSRIAQGDPKGAIRLLESLDDSIVRDLQQEFWDLWEDDR